MEAVANQAKAKSNPEIESAAWLIVAAAAVRTAFGVLMAIDAWLKWQPGFAAHYVGYLQNAANGQPHWLQAVVSHVAASGHDAHRHSSFPPRDSLKRRLRSVCCSVSRGASLTSLARCSVC